MDLVDQLMTSVRGGGHEAGPAALALALLIERECVRSWTGEDGIAVAIGERLASQRLSPQQVSRATHELITYIEGTAAPHPTAVFALGKTYDPRAGPALAALVRRTLADPDLEPVGYQALIALESVDGVGCVDVVRHAAAAGSGQTRDHAERYLAAHQLEP